MTRLHVLVLLALALFACGEDRAPGGPTSSAQTTPAPARAFRVTAHASLATADVDRTVAAIRKETERAGGYVGDTLTHGAGATLTVHYPVSERGHLREVLAQLGDLGSESEHADDVTEQRADTEARLRNSRMEETRLLALLQDRTGTLSDVIAVEKELARVRGDIEKVEAEKRTLDGQVDLATVTIDVTPKSAPGARILGATKDGSELAGSVAVGLVVIAVRLGPTLLMFGLPAILALVLTRRVRRRHRSALQSA